MKKERFNYLIKRIKFDRKALEEIYDWYFAPIVKHINRSFRGKLDGRDIAQQFFLRILDIEIRETIKYPTSWVYKVSDYIAIELLRKKDKQKAAEQSAAAESVLYIEEDSKEMLKCLREDLRQIIYLHYWERYTLKEIAGLLLLGYSNVKAKHREAKKILKKEIEKEIQNEKQFKER